MEPTELNLDLKPTFHEKLERVLDHSSRAAFWTDYDGDDPKLLPTVQYAFPDDEAAESKVRSLLSDKELQTQLTGDAFERAVLTLNLWEQSNKQSTRWRKKITTTWQSYTPMPKFQQLASQVGLEGTPPTNITDEHIQKNYFKQRLNEVVKPVEELADALPNPELP